MALILMVSGSGWGMHRLKLVELAENRAWMWFGDYSGIDPICRRSARIYEASLRRVLGLAGALGHAFMHGELWMEATYLARRVLPDADVQSQEFKLQCLREFIKVAKWPNDAAFAKDHRKATHNADEHCFQVDPIYEGFHAIVQSTVIQAWSAFEVLCDDLWKDVKNANPHLFHAMSQGQKDALSFRSRKKIRKSYESLFKTDDSTIRAALAPTVIDTLALMRNLLIHSNGNIDEFFIRDSENIPEVAHFRTLAEGTPVIFDGIFARSLIDPVTPCAYNLVKSVSDWIPGH